MNRILITLLAASLILGAGLLHGKIIDRWGDSHEMNDAVARLQNLPASFGEWTSQAYELNPRHLQVAEIKGYVTRQYVHKRSGERISILLICGRPGPISVHTPDVCYQGAGYKMGTKVKQMQKDPGTSQVSEFWAARFTKEPQPAPLNILWTWSDGGRWIAPDNPRLQFYRSKVLFKMYFSREAKSLNAPVVDEVTQSFMTEFFPVLQKTLNGQPTQTVQ